MTKITVGERRRNKFNMEEREKLMEWVGAQIKAKKDEGEILEWIVKTTHLSLNTARNLIMEAKMRCS